MSELKTSDFYFDLPEELIAHACAQGTGDFATTQIVCKDK